MHIDINQFSSKTLVNTYGEQAMEVREQVLNCDNLAIIFHFSVLDVADF